MNATTFVNILMEAMRAAVRDDGLTPHALLNATLEFTGTVLVVSAEAGKDRQETLDLFITRLRNRVLKETFQ